MEDREPAPVLGPRRRRRPQFLAPKGRSGNGHGYLDQPPRRLDASMFADPPAVVELVAAATSMTDEPECVGPAIADQFGEHARFLHRQRRAAILASAYEIRARLAPAQRLADCVRRAKRLHVDISGDVRPIERGLEETRRGHSPRHDAPVRPAIVKRLEQLEARLDESIDPWNPRA